MVSLNQLLSTGWVWVLLAGAGGLACGWALRRAWTAQADAARVGELARVGQDALQRQADADSLRSQIRGLEADLVKQRQRVAEVEAASAAELQMLTMKLASNAAKAAGFERAHEAAQNVMAERDRVSAERDRVSAELKAQRQAVESALAEASAQADARRATVSRAAKELAVAQNTWNIERATLTDERDLKLAAQERAHREALRRSEEEAATLTAEVARLMHVELQVEELRTLLEAGNAALRDKNHLLSALERRLLLLSPLPGRVAVAENALSAARRKLADRDAALVRLWAEAPR